MLSLRIEDLLKATRGKLDGSNKECKPIKEIVTDSRLAKEGTLFVCLEGERFDGHDFIDQAICQGCKVILVHKEIKRDGIDIIRAKNTELAYGDLARYYRYFYEENLQKPLIVVGVTGSVGKTSTKDLVYECLSKKYRTLKNSFNENNEIGLPKTILKLDDQEALVIEMGMRGLGQVQYLAEIARPGYGLITNIGSSHLELLKTRDNILKAKAEITKGLIGEKILFINGDDPLLTSHDFEDGANLMTFGLGQSNDFRGQILDDSTFILYDPDGRDYRVSLSLRGKHNVYNALAAIGISFKCGVPIQDAIDACMAYRGDMVRQNIFDLENLGLEIISDTYNANFESMKASIDVLSTAKGKRKIAVLGDMLELGDYSRQYHEALGSYLLDKNIDIVYAVGEQTSFLYDIVKDKKSSFYFKDTEAAFKSLVKIVKKGDSILVKGSNAMKMDYIVDKLIEEDKKI